MRRLKRILFRKSRINHIVVCLIMFIAGLGVAAYGGRIYTESNAYISGAGRVRDMRDDEKAVFQEAMLELYGDESYEQYAVYKTLEYKVFPRQMTITDWSVSIFGLLFSIFSIWGMFYFGRDERREILYKVERSGIEPDRIAGISYQAL